MENFVELLADFKVRDLNEFERLIETMTYVQIIEVQISLMAMLRRVKDKRESIEPKAS